jgi:hypothetical protein
MFRFDFEFETLPAVALDFDLWHWREYAPLACLMEMLNSRGFP